MAHYKVLSFDKYSGSLTIQFAENVPPLNVDVPINETGLFMTGQELDQYIQGFVPTWHIDRLEKLKNGVSNVAEVEALVDPAQEVILPSIPQVSDEELATRKMLLEIAEEQRIAKILVKFGVLTEDPTAIPNTTL